MVTSPWPRSRVRRAQRGDLLGGERPGVDVDQHDRLVAGQLVERREGLGVDHVDPQAGRPQASASTGALAGHALGDQDAGRALDLDGGVAGVVLGRRRRRRRRPAPGSGPSPLAPATWGMVTVLRPASTSTTRSSTTSPSRRVVSCTGPAVSASMVTSRSKASPSAPGWARRRRRRRGRPRPPGRPAGTRRRCPAR